MWADGETVRSVATIDEDIIGGLPLTLRVRGYSTGLF
jgi:hypothetical protein